MVDGISLSVCRDVRRAPLPGHTSAHDGAGGSGARALREKVMAQGRHGGRCHFCHFKFGNWNGFEVHHLDANHSNNESENLVPICFLCHLPFHLDLVAKRWPGASGEVGRVIRCPELSQAALNQMLYALFYAAAKARASDDDDQTRQIWSVYHRLQARGDALEQEGGRTVRRDLSKVNVVVRLLQDASDAWYADRDSRLSGCRYLPPFEPMIDMASQWAQEGAGFSKLDVGTWGRLFRGEA